MSRRDVRVCYHLAALGLPLALDRADDREVFVEESAESAARARSAGGATAALDLIDAPKRVRLTKDTSQTAASTCLDKRDLFA